MPKKTKAPISNKVEIEKKEKVEKEKVEKEKVEKREKKSIDDLNVDELMNMEHDDILETAVSNKKHKKNNAKTDTSKKESKSKESKEEEEEEELNKEIIEHQKQLELFKSTDPEFYKHLQQNEANLLNFGLEEEGEQEEDEQEDPNMDDPETTAKAEYTLEDVKILEKSMTSEPSFTTLKKLLKVFRSGCALYNDTDKTEAIEEEANLIAPAFNHVAAYLIKNVANQFNALFATDKTKTIKKSTDKSDKDTEEVAAVDFSSSKWKKNNYIVKSYLSNLVAYATHSLDQDNQRKLLVHLNRLNPYFKNYLKIQQKVIKVVLGWFATSEEIVRFESFILLRSIALMTPTLLEIVLKQSYLTYVKNCKFYNKNSCATIIFMNNSLVELFCLSPQISYSYLFVYLRQMAIHLRGAITKSDFKVSSVYNWQFLNCLRLIGCILSKQCKVENNTPSTSPLVPLIYPFVQLCFSLLDYMPTVRFFPLRFFVVKLLTMISDTTRVYIPIAVQLMPVLQVVTSEKKKKHLIKGQFNSFTFAIHASKTAIQSKHFSDFSFNEMVNSLLNFFCVHAYSVTFPELIAPTVMQLKKGIKSMKNNPENGKASKTISNLITQLEDNARWITSKRNELTLSPKDVKDGMLKSQGIAPLITYADKIKRDGFIMDKVEGSIKSKNELDSTKVDEEEDDIDKVQHAKEKSKAKKSKSVNDEDMGEYENPTENDIVRDMDISDDEVEEDE